MPTDVTAALRAAEVDSADLLSVLQAHFKSARWEHGQEVYFPSHGPPQLVVRFDRRDGRVLQVEAQDSLSELARTELARAVHKALLEPLAPQVQHTVLFFSRPVRGTYRAPDSSFQISPVPAGSPQPDVLVADHPFLLSYLIQPSTESSVTADRAVRGKQEWAWFLNAVLRGGVTSLGLAARHHWVLADRDLSRPVVESVLWAQEFYAIADGGRLPADRFPELGSSLKVVEGDRYYSRLGDGADELTLPALFERTIAAFNALDPGRRDRFLRSAQWYDAALGMWSTHYGSGLGALVSAIETLAWRERPADPCPTCGRDRNPGPTARFKAFVDRYAREQAIVKPRDAYARRSALLHGANRLAIDVPGFTAFVPSYLRDRDEWEGLMRLTQIVVINWLLDPD